MIQKKKLNEIQGEKRRRGFIEQKPLFDVRILTVEEL